MTARNHHLALPLAFWQDHQERDLPAGAVQRRTARRVYLRCSNAELAELLSDARHYASGDVDLASGGLVASAKATVRAIDAYCATWQVAL